MDEEFDAKVKDITGLYLTAIERSQNGEHTISVDEMTGIQAIERLEKDLPMLPSGKLQEESLNIFVMVRRPSIANFNIANGKIIELFLAEIREQNPIFYSIFVT